MRYLEYKHRDVGSVSACVQRHKQCEHNRRSTICCMSQAQQRVAGAPLYPRRTVHTSHRTSNCCAPNCLAERPSSSAGLAGEKGPLQTRVLGTISKCVWLGLCPVILASQYSPFGGSLLLPSWMCRAKTARGMCKTRPNSAVSGSAIAGYHALSPVTHAIFFQNRMLPSPHLIPRP